VSAGVQNQLTALTDKALPLTLAGGVAVTLLGTLRGQRLRAAVADGVAVAVAAVPEGLPLVSTVAQLAGARRLSRRGVLVRSSRTVEALGRVDTMCFDKTGTLTLGRLDLVGLADLDGEWTPAAASASPDARRLLRAAARACEQPGQESPVHATDRAILAAADTRLGRQAAHVWDPVEELPFESHRGYAATLGHTRKRLRMVVKGAPEVLLARCNGILRIDPVAGGDGRQVLPFPEADRKAAEAVVHRLAARGLRVLAVARRDLSEMPGDVESAVAGLTLMGFVALADTPRPETVPVVAELNAAGISTRMITGDHPVTAAAIARQLGIGSGVDGDVVTGPQLDALPGEVGRAVISGARVFARMSPEQKVRIVAALQASGRVVAMTGDGSNDAAAIRLADVGIGIATHGSTAARNAADLVLTSPDMTLLLESVVEGRAMWQRVRDAVAILVGGNAGEVVFTLLGSAISGRAPLGTRQFLLVNLLTDMLPAMAVALTPAAAPQTTRSAQEALTTRTRAVEAGRALAAIPRPELGRDLLRGIALRGGATAAGAGTAWLLGRVSGRGRRASTMGLVALVGTQLGQTLLVGRRSPLVWVTVVGSGVALAVIVQTPGVSRFFGCVPLGPVAWTTVAVSSIGGTALSVVLPLVFRKLDLAGLTGTSRVTRMPSSTRPVETLLTSARTAVPRPSPR
jgi:cation-transporting ATPase I